MIVGKTKEELRKDPNSMIPLSFDEVFKRIFGTEECKSITAELLSPFLELPPKYIEKHLSFANTNNNKTINGKMDKDILVKIETKPILKISIEMNRYKTFYQEYVDRNIVYLADTFSSGIISNNYLDLPYGIQINFNVCYVDNNAKNNVDIYLLRNESGHVLSDKFKIYYINVYEMSKMWYNHSYKKLNSYEKLISLFGALIIENDEKEFNKILNELNIDMNTKNRLKGIVDDMKAENDLITRFYDKDEYEKFIVDVALKHERENARNEEKNL